MKFRSQRLIDTAAVRWTILVPPCRCDSLRRALSSLAGFIATFGAVDAVKYPSRYSLKRSELVVDHLTYMYFRLLFERGGGDVSVVLHVQNMQAGIVRGPASLKDASRQRYARKA